ncbi:hypothetical protein GALL_552870 [mine drainage metagenome]|uniref:Uncharacterized protein n=1 Tax=mine drainage metagenome TaxID=410659 RepID=A0A1J5P6V8_9ZZZZ
MQMCECLDINPLFAHLHIRTLATAACAAAADSLIALFLFIDITFLSGCRGSKFEFTKTIAKC